MLTEFMAPATGYFMREIFGIPKIISNFVTRNTTMLKITETTDATT